MRQRGAWSSFAGRGRGDHDSRVGPALRIAYARYARPHVAWACGLVSSGVEPFLISICAVAFLCAVAFVSLSLAHPTSSRATCCCQTSPSSPATNFLAIYILFLLLVLVLERGVSSSCARKEDAMHSAAAHSPAVSKPTGSATVNQRCGKSRI